MTITITPPIISQGMPFSAFPGFLTLNVLLSSPTSGKYEPEEQIELNFRLEEISGKGVRNVRPQLYLKGPGGFTKKINGDSLKVGVDNRSRGV